MTDDEKHNHAADGLRHMAAMSVAMTVDPDRERATTGKVPTLRYMLDSGVFDETGLVWPEITSEQVAAMLQGADPGPAQHYACAGGRIPGTGRGGTRGKVNQKAKARKRKAQKKARRAGRKG